MCVKLKELNERERIEWEYGSNELTIQEEMMLKEIEESIGEKERLEEEIEEEIVREIRILVERKGLWAASDVLELLQERNKKIKEGC